MAIPFFISIKTPLIDWLHFQSNYRKIMSFFNYIRYQKRGKAFPLGKNHLSGHNAPNFAAYFPRTRDIHLCLDLCLVPTDIQETSKRDGSSVKLSTARPNRTGFTAKLIKKF